MDRWKKAGTESLYIKWDLQYKDGYKTVRKFTSTEVESLPKSVLKSCLLYDDLSFIFGRFYLVFPLTINKTLFIK